MIYVLDVGQPFTVDTGIDLSAVTTKQLQVRRPDGSIVIWSYVFVGTGSTGLQSTLTHYSQSGELWQAGTYEVQPYVITPTFNGHTLTAYFQVNQLFT